MTPQISLFASAARPQFWPRLYKSLEGNKVSFELCFVGPKHSTFTLPSNFKWKLSFVKPSQCYQAASQMCSGELIGWMADDCNYNHPTQQCSNSLDLIWEAYQRLIEERKDKKSILSQKTFEDYGPYNKVPWENHHFFYANKNTPRMAPLGFINREYFNKLGGYDRNFVCGQSENDIVMRVLEDGGRVIDIPESKVYLAHRECHGLYNFRKGYTGDRKFLESCWMVDGRTVSKKRLRPFEPFVSNDLLTVNQGNPGAWK